MSATESTMTGLTAGLANSPKTVWTSKEFVDHGVAGSDKEAGHSSLVDDPEVSNSEDYVDAAAATAEAPAAPATAQQTDPEFRLEICKLCPEMADETASVFNKESERRGKLFLPTQLCKFYGKGKGYCTKGDCCPYAHTLEEIPLNCRASALERREAFHLHSGPEGSGKGYRVNVSNLDCRVNEDHLKALFQKYGEVLDAKIQVKDDGNSKGKGNVTFKTKEEAHKARANLNTKKNVRLSAVMVSAENKPLNVFVPPERQEDDDKNKGDKPHKKNNKTGRHPKMSPKVVPQMMQQHQFYFCYDWTGAWWPVPVFA